jgi:hypothetical protein
MGYPGVLVDEYSISTQGDGGKQKQVSRRVGFRPQREFTVDVLISGKIVAEVV